jgi:hypothetical protein
MVVCVFLVLFACIAIPGTLRAQSDDSIADLPFAKGFRLSAGLSYGHPQLDSRLAAVWERAGKFGGGDGGDVGLGYDWSRFGLSLGMALANASLGARHAATLSLSAVAHWIPPASFDSPIGPLHPIVTVGYVREAFGGVELVNDDLPPEIATEDPSTQPSSMSFIGNGARLGVAVEQAFASPFAVRLGVDADVVRFGSYSYHGFDWSLDPGGTGVLYRGVIRLIWRPS